MCLYTDLVLQQQEMQPENQLQQEDSLLLKVRLPKYYCPPFFKSFILLATKFVDNVAKSTTETELKGINIAATIGDSIP